MNIRITVKQPKAPRPIVNQAIKAGLDTMTTAAVDIQKGNAPVRYGAPNAGTLRRSIYGDFTRLDSFKAAVVQDGSIAPWGPIVNNGYAGIIKPRQAQALKIHENNGIFFRKQAHGQAAQHWWEKIEHRTADLQAAFIKGFNRIFKGG